MSKKIQVDCFSEKSIQNAINELKKYQRDLQRKTELVAQELAELGVQYSRLHLEDLDAVFTGELMSSIRPVKEYSGNGVAVFAVVADSEHAMFVFFGTGVIGKASPYNGKLPDGLTWEYAVGKTIRQLADGRYGWFYPGNDGRWRFTQGMPSRPFFDYAMDDLEIVCRDVVKKVFSNG